ncbi:MAG: hypothetical protein SOR77_02910 [Peptoniphilus sp.]|uniref:hypothetical protein n=1 Tax=Peptoniphilus sp. TaxID=1971214 RepID=UPI002A7638C5|nr:hypothetical protein [Peptoniphilus sp.]MDY2986568.1 hypothetical protein [Peptoniphilus sp.]
MKKDKRQKLSLKNYIFSFGATSWILTTPLCVDIGHGDFNNPTPIKFEVVIFFILTILGILANLHSIFISRELKWTQKGFAFMVILWQLCTILLMKAIIEQKGLFL